MASSATEPKGSLSPTVATVAQHLGYLDGLRAVAALYVLIHHSFLQVAETSANRFDALRFFEVLRYGRYSVDLFIVLSGFCLMLPVVKHSLQLRGGALNFFKRRAWRIVPPYYACMFLSLLLIWTLIGHETGTHWDSSLPVTWKSIWSHLLLIHDFVGEDFSINSPFWSIAVEWRIYFLFPLLVWMWRRCGPFVSTAISFVVALGLCVVLRKAIGTTLTSDYIFLFVLGMLATTLVFSPEARFERWRRLPWGAICLVLFLAVVLCSLVHSAKEPPAIWVDLIMGVWASTILMWVSSGNNWGRKLLSWSPLVWIGTFAYSIYLVHSPLIQLLWQYPFARLQSQAVPMMLALIFIGTPIMVGIAYLFFLGCERPFLRRRSLARPEALVVKTVLESAP